ERSPQQIAKCRVLLGAFTNTLVVQRIANLRNSLPRFRAASSRRLLTSSPEVVAHLVASDGRQPAAKAILRLLFAKPGDVSCNRGEYILDHVGHILRHYAPSAAPRRHERSIQNNKPRPRRRIVPLCAP